jgi:hypothetical protein
VTISDILGILASLALGAYLGWFVLRSSFSFDRVFRWPVARDNHEWLRSFLFALAIAWVAMGVAYLNRWCEVQRLPDCGPVASILGGMLVGVSVGMLGQCPVTIILASGATSIWALIALAAWVSGIVAGLHATWLVMAFARIQEFGLLDFGWQGLNDFAGIPRWIALLLAGVALGAWMVSHPVVVRRSRMEWPKQGAILGIVIVVGWALALAGGNWGGMNLVEAVDDVWTGLTGGVLEFRPALLMLLGLAGWGFISMLRSGKLFSDPVVEPMQVVVLVAASFLLGLACALAKGDPVAHCLFGAGVLQASSLLFAGGMWGGAAIFGRLGKRLVRKGEK